MVYANAQVQHTHAKELEQSRARAREGEVCKYSETTQKSFTFFNTFLPIYLIIRT